MTLTYEHAKYLHQIRGHFVLAHFTDTHTDSADRLHHRATKAVGNKARMQSRRVRLRGSRMLDDCRAQSMSTWLLLLLLRRAQIHHCPSISHY